MGQPMDLEFSIPELAAVIIAVFIVAEISKDGRTNWLEGVQLAVGCGCVIPGSIHHDKTFSFVWFRLVSFGDGLQAGREKDRQGPPTKFALT